MCLEKKFDTLYKKEEEFMNHVILIGTLKSKEDVQTKKKITLSVKRTYKSEKGFFETDDITCLLWSGIISKVDNYFNEGDKISVHGRLEERNNSFVVLIEQICLINHNLNN